MLGSLSQDATTSQRAAFFTNGEQQDDARNVRAAQWDAIVHLE